MYIKIKDGRRDEMAILKVWQIDNKMQNSVREKQSVSPVDMFQIFFLKFQFNIISFGTELPKLREFWEQEDDVPLRSVQAAEHLSPNAGHCNNTSLFC
jgi:hypothetical protein